MPEETLDKVRLSRRKLLAGMGATGGAIVLAACAGNGNGDSDLADTGAPGVPSQDDVARQAAQVAGVDAEISLTVLVASFEMLTGPGRRLQFGLLDNEQRPLLGDEVQAFVVDDVNGAVLQGPVTPSFHDEGLGARGIYVFASDIPEPGVHSLVVQTSDGQRAGVGPIRVLAPEQSPIVQVAQDFPPSDTPTVDDPQDLLELCTRDPDCGMHEHKLGQALADGKPIVLTIATPKYCVSRICGPIVDIVEDIRLTGIRDDVAWIHVEVFKDDQSTDPVDLVTELSLPSEPWVFLIDADGKLADKFDGPVTGDLLRDALPQI